MRASRCKPKPTRSVCELRPFDGVSARKKTEILAAEAEKRRARLAAELLASAAQVSTAERVRAFLEQMADAGQPSSTTAASSAAATGTAMGLESRLYVLIVRDRSLHCPGRLQDSIRECGGHRAEVKVLASVERDSHFLQYLAAAEPA
jgi:hypothetical protein